MQHRLPFTIVIIAIMLCIQGMLSVVVKAQSSVEEGSQLMSSIYEKDWQERNEMIPLAALLQKVEHSFNVTFLYEQNLLENRHIRRNQVDLTKETGRELSQVLSGLGFTYHQIDDETYVILAKKSNLNPVILQQTITGTVTDSETGETIPGVNISVPGTAIGTTTDMDGQYELDNIPDDVTELVYSYVGYQSQTVQINGRSVINVELEQEVAMLDDIVVIGYGERQRGDITGSISTVSAEKLERGSSVSPELALQGRTTGVHISGVSGNPLERPDIRIRGISTFGVADPLIVIDGVPITEFGAGAEGGAAVVRDLRGNVNILSLISPGDIESISVLKDASSAAIYGVRGANGVILITTKQGQTGAPQVQISVQRGIQNVSQMDVLNVEQYTDFYRQAYANNPDQADQLPSVFDPSSADYLGNMPTVDWHDAMINQDAVTEDYSARVSGGTESIQYYLSGGYARTEGTIVGDQLERYSLSGNVTSNISDIVRAGATYRVVYADALDNKRGASMGEANQAPPWQPIFDSDGQYWEMVGHPDTYAAGSGFAPVTNIEGESLWGPQRRQNALGRQALSETSYELVRNIGSAFIEVEPLRNLAFRGTINVDWNRNLRKQFTDREDHWYNWTASGPDPSLQPGSVGGYGERNNINRNITGEFRVNYRENFGSHNIDLLGNISRQEYGVRILNSSGNYVPLRDPDQWGIIRTADPESTDAFTTRQDDALMGILGRVSYNFDSRYYLDLTVRRDGTSRFAPGHKWGTFPSVSGSWRVSSESFMDNVDFIDDLRIRAGWGRLGNQETARFAYISGVGDSPTYAFGARPGEPLGTVRRAVRLADFPVEDLSWEVVTTYNIGFESLLFNNRLSLTAEYYNRVTDGILQTVPLAASVGIQNNPTFNIAEVLNRGLEFEIGYNDIIGPLQYNISANLTTVHNEVLHLYEGIPFGGEQDRVDEGESLFFFRGYKVGGIFQDQAEVDAWLAENEEPGSIKSPGDIYYEDLNGDGVIDADDRTKIGSPIPDYYYGFNVDLFYQGFDLSLFFQGVGGIQRVNNVRWSGESMASDGNNQLTSVLDRWTPENPSSTMPRAVRNDPGNNNRFSDRWVENADFLRLKNLQFGYTVPPEIAEKAGLGQSTLRLFLSGSNLFTVTEWTGLDPENDLVPPARTISLGLNLTIR